MTQGKHTPGPWAVGNRYSETGVFSADGETLVANTHSSQRNFDRDAQVTEQHANARLIAAAPDLLEALRGLVAEHLPDAEANFEYLSREGNHAQLEQEECDLRKWQAARAVIAKATGEPK